MRYLGDLYLFNLVLSLLSLLLLLLLLLLLFGLYHGAACFV